MKQEMVQFASYNCQIKQEMVQLQLSNEARDGAVTAVKLSKRWCSYSCQIKQEMVQLQLSNEVRDGAVTAVK